MLVKVGSGQGLIYLGYCDPFCSLKGVFALDVRVLGDRRREVMSIPWKCALAQKPAIKFLMHRHKILTALRHPPILVLQVLISSLPWVSGRF